MSRFLAVRLAEAALVVCGVLVVVFMTLRLSGDPVKTMAPIDATAADLEVIRDNLGLDEPLPLQFGTFVENAATGDLGYSYQYQAPVTELVRDAFPRTFVLVTAALLLAAIVGISAGVVAALRAGGWPDSLLSLLVTLVQGLPVFWLGILLLLLFSVELGWFPSGGWGSVRHAVLPVVALAAYPAARLSRLARSEMLETISQDYVRTARSKGLSPTRIVVRHALRNTLLPLVSVLGIDFSFLMGGAVIAENVFSIPGLGHLAVSAVVSQDFPVVQGAVIAVAVTVVITNLVTDIGYGVLDPRIRIG